MFLGSGSVIHAMHHEQDMRNMGNLKSYMKITWITFIIGTLAISGIPPFSGFFSKDLILEKAFSYHGIGNVLWAIGLMGAFCTAFYMFRLVFLTFYGNERIDHHVKEHLHESPLSITIPLMLLAVGAAFAGLLQVPHIFFGGTHILSDYFKPIFESGEMAVKTWGIVSEPHEMSTSLEIALVVISVGIASVGIAISFVLFNLKKSVPPTDDKITGFSKILYNKYYVDEFYELSLIKPILKISEWLARAFDKIVIDGFIVGIGKVFLWVSSVIRKVQTGIVGDYAFSIVIGAIVILLYLTLKGA